MYYCESDLIEEFFSFFKTQEIDIQNNPHSTQCFQTDFCYRCSNSYQYLRILDDSIPRSPYRRREKEIKSVIHNGQRKLLLSEIEFLSCFTYIYPKVSKVLYIGAAPGTHISYLADLFDNLTFYLYDKSKFKLKKRKNIKIFNKFFTNEDVKDYAYENCIFFISDIRRSEEEEFISEDMKLQESWVKTIRPAASSLKFRLPYAQDKVIKYIQGDIYLPVFGTKTTTETRLFIDSRDVDICKEYNSRIYEEQMFYFNTILRPSVYPNPAPNPKIGLDYCYDCTTETYILWKYLKYLKYLKYQEHQERDEREERKKRDKREERLRTPNTLLDILRDMSLDISLSISGSPMIIDVDEMKKY
jgi:hypothetical protein